MDERLLGIVKERTFAPTHIDENALRELTTWIPFHQMRNISWSQVRHLHILNRDSLTKVDMGIYVSEDHTWVLLLGDPDVGVQQILNRCLKHLELLNISAVFRDVLDLTEAHDLRHLRVITAFQSHTPVCISDIAHLTKLEYLSLMDVRFGDILDLSGMSELMHLHIVHNTVGCPPTVFGIHNLKKLHTLNLWHVFWYGCIDMLCFPELERLALFGRSAELSDGNGVHGITMLKNLQSLRLYGDLAAAIEDLSPLTNLRSLYLRANRSLTTLNGIEHLQKLTHLCIPGTGIKRIPEGIRHLKKLRHLDLSHLILEELPYWLPELGLRLSQTGRKSVDLTGTEVAGVDMSIFQQPEDVIRKWFEDLNTKSMVPLQEVKVVFLGDGEAGKTHTIARLLNDGGLPQTQHFDDKATPGIVIRDKSYDLGGNPVKVHFWDFGGQEILHSMHRMFLTERTLYVVLINARDDTQDDRARYWLHNIRSFAGNSPVLLVLNKVDQNPNASINETELRELYGGLRSVVRLSALEYSQEEFDAAFTDVLKQEIQALGTIGTLWPSSWAKLKTGLASMKDHFITGRAYKAMCRDCGVDQNQKELLNWFNDLGVSFFYQGNRRLEDYVILRPEWITNGIYILLFNKSDETQNGVIPKRAIHEMLDPEDENTYHRVLKGVTYNVSETEYVLEVMRKFRLSYAVSDEAEFIPALCQRDSMPVAKQYADAPDTLEFRLTYDYLPDNVIHRLMVEMRQDLQLSNVWRTGALFRQKGTALSAVVKSEGDVLRIFVQSEDPMHRPNTYLCILKENIDRINRDMKLAAPFAEVVYKTDNGKECFDYQDLLDAQKDGEETYRSKLLRRRVPIQDILNQTGRAVELELKQLQRDIITACMQLQEEPMYWGSSEDQRNTYLRNALRNCGHLVNDQSFRGVGSGRRGYGELDLEIRREANIPWTVLEALRIKDGSKTGWNSHLKKLLDNYNPSGLNHLFLLTYVDCSKDDFDPLLNKFSEHVRWHDELPYVRLPNTFSHIPMHRHGEPAYVQVMRCTYDRNGAPTTVTHIFVRIGQ